MVKWLTSLMVSALFLIRVVYAGVEAVPPCTFEDPLKSFSPQAVVGFMECFIDNIFVGKFWIDNTLQIAVFVIFPLLLIIILLYAVLDEINFFKRNEINVIIAVLLALMALPTGILTGLVFFFASIGAMISVLTVLALIFGLGISYYYRVKAEDYNFFMDSRVLTIYLVYLPFLIMMVGAGVIIGGLANPSGKGYMFSSLFIAGFIDLFWILIILMVISLFLLYRNYRNEGLAILFIGLVNLSLLLAPMFLDNELVRSRMIGAAIGLLIVNFYVILERGRRWGLETIAQEGARRLGMLVHEERDLLATRRDLYAVLQHIRAAGGRARAPRDVWYKGERLIRQGQEYSADEVSDLYDEYDQLLRALRQRITAERALHRDRYLQRLYGRRGTP